MSGESTLEAARARDALDPLRGFRERFALPRDAHGEPLIYLCGHSLGLLPLAARELVIEELDEWARLGVQGHEHARRPWVPYHENLTAALAALSGAHPSEVVAMNSLTVNLHLMLASFYRPTGRRSRILMEAGAFSSDRHAVASQIAWHGLDPATALLELAPRAGEDTVPEEAIDACLREHGEEIALVLWPGVQFRTGQAFDLARIVRAAHRHGCIAGFDLAHAIGNTPLALHEAGADFAVWCSYKYLNGGPGAIGGCFVQQRHADAQPRQHHSGGLPGARLAGWWGHEQTTRFLMEPQFRAAAGAAAWQISNPPILAAACLAGDLHRGAHGAAAREVGAAQLLSRAAAAAARGAGTPHHAAREGAARLSAVAAHRGRCRARGARVRGARRTRHGVRLALARHHPGGAGAVVQPL